MSGEDGIEAWVDGQKYGGVADEEEQSFTIDTSKAWSKLGEFQLPKKEFWVLLLVQAAVEAGCTRLEISQRRKLTTFRFIDSPWTEKNIRQALFRIEDVPDGLSRLSAGLRALALGAELPFSLCYPNGPKEEWDGVELSRCEDGDAGPFQIEVAHLQRGQRDLLGFKLAHARAEIFSVLTTYCFCSSMPISCDGLSVTEYLRDPNCGIPGAVPLACLRIDSIDSMPRLKLNKSRAKLKSRILGFAVNQDQVWVLDEALLAALEKGGEVGALALVSFSQRPVQENELQIAFVKSGVVLHRERFVLRFELTVTIFLSADGLETDLSGFSFRGRDLVLERCSLARDGLVESLKGLEQESMSLTPRVSQEFPTRKVGKGVAAYAALGTLFAGPAGFAVTAVHGSVAALIARGAFQANGMLWRRLRRNFPISNLVATLEKVRLKLPEEPAQAIRKRARRAGRSWESERWGGR